MNGYRRIKEELAGGPPTKHKTTIALSPARARVPGIQLSGARASTVQARSPHGPDGARLAADGVQARGAAAAGPQAGCSANNQELVEPPLVQAMNQPAILCHSLGAIATPSLLAPGGPMRQPPGLEQRTRFAQERRRSFDNKTAGSLRGGSLPRRPSATPVLQISQGPPLTLHVSNATVVEEKAPDAVNLEPPKVCGQLAIAVAKAVIQELDDADNEHFVQCAGLLAWVLDCSYADRDNGTPQGRRV